MAFYLCSLYRVICPGAIHRRDRSSRTYSVYAYSGGAPANTTPVTALDFTTGNEYIVGERTLSLAIQDEAASTAVAISNVDLNGELSFNLLAGFSGADSAPSDSIKILIPPQSRFTANLYSDENQSARLMTLVFTGRVYA